MIHSDILDSLLISAHRLTRIAANATGDGTPSAVWRTLSILETDGPMRVGQLAAASRVTQPGMTRLIGTMADGGLIRRIADSDDARAWLIAVTAEGSRALADWRATISATLEPSFGDLSDRDWDTLARAAELLGARTATRARDENAAS